MQQIAKISHVPIREPMYANGVMTTAWILFFEKLAQGADMADFVDLLNVHAKTHELPPISPAVGQMLIEHGDDVGRVCVPCHDDNVTFLQLPTPTQEVL